MIPTNDKPIKTIIMGNMRFTPAKMNKINGLQKYWGKYQMVVA
jgi:hypothetical protein